MPSKTRPESARDVTMLSGLVLFLGFIALGWATVATFGKDYPQSVSAALLGIGLMLAGIGIRLKLLAPGVGGAGAGAAPDAGAAGSEAPAASAAEAKDSDGDWPGEPGARYGDPDGK